MSCLLLPVLSRSMNADNIRKTSPKHEIRSDGSIASCEYFFAAVSPARRDVNAKFCGVCRTVALRQQRCNDTGEHSRRCHLGHTGIAGGIEETITRRCSNKAVVAF
jgi:hypothetical protein